MDISVLTSEGLRDACAYARLRPEFAAALETERPTLLRPEWRVRFEHLHERLFVRGEIRAEDAPAWAAPLPTSPEPIPRLFHAFVFLSGMPGVRAEHAARGIPEEISRATFLDLDLWIDDHRRRTGQLGLDALAWLHNHLAGRLVAIGRLQYRFEPFPANLAALAPPPHPGADAPVLSVHVPASGPLEHDACERSLREAAAFFPRHYPDRPSHGFVCYSWLLDPALTEHLPADSNIVRFQRRFAVFALPKPNDAPFRDLFPEAWLDPQTCRPKTALQAALRDRLLAGKCWAVHGGVLRA